MSVNKTQDFVWFVNNSINVTVKFKYRIENMWCMVQVHTLQILTKDKLAWNDNDECYTFNAI